MRAKWYTGLMPHELIVRSGTGAGQAVRLDADRYTFGRAANNDYSFPEDGELSRQHLAFERFGDGWLVLDLGSRNGTLVNGKAIRIEGGDYVLEGLECQCPKCGAQWSETVSGKTVRLCGKCSDEVEDPSL